MQKIEELGRLPKETAKCSPAERQLARQLRDARKAKQILPEQLQVRQKSEELMQQVRD